MRTTNSVDTGAHLAPPGSENPHLAEHQDRFAKLISHRVPFTDAERAFDLALTPGPHSL